MRNKKIISSLLILIGFMSFLYVSSLPKTVVGTAAMTITTSTQKIAMPTLRPLPTLNIQLRKMMPIISETPRVTATPNLTAKPIVTVTPTPSKSPSTQSSINSSYTAQIIDLVNIERGKNNLISLTINNELSNSAQTYAQYMADKNFFSHNGPNGSTFISRNKSAGYYPYYTLGENIAAGQHTPQQAMAAWMNSSGHRANILNPDYKEIGVGYVYKTGTKYNHYWVQELGAR